MIRRGSLLIIVSGLSVLLASLAVAFLSRARADIDEADAAQRIGQARIMLTAACCYVMEASPPATHDPVLASGTNAFFPRFGSLGGTPRLIGRFPMHVQSLPPHAVSPRRVYDPYDAFRPYEWRHDPTRYFSMPNPLNTGQLITANEQVPGVEATSAGGTKASFPIARTMNLSWFRIWYPGSYSEGDIPYSSDGTIRTRAAKAVFIVTCGAGASLGFRDWSELSASDRALFGNDANNFNLIVANETRMWFEVHWSTINVYQDGKPSANAHPPMFSDASDPATYSANLFVLPPGAPTAVPSATNTGDQYVIPWDPIRSARDKTNNLSAPKAATSPAVPPLPAEAGWNLFPQSLESDAFRYHGRIVRLVRLQSMPAGGAW